jgi:hypothetical protein
MIVTTTPAVAIGQRVLGTDLCFTDMAHVLSEVPATQSTYSRSSARPARPAGPTGCGGSDTMTPGMPDVLRSKYDGLDKAAPRTPHSCTPTTVWWWWCGEVVQPVVEASVPQRSVCRRL